MRIPVIAILAFALVFSAVTGTRYAAADEVVGNKKELQRIKREMQDKKNKIKRADKKARSILTELDRIDRDIQAAKVELAEQQKELREAEAALQDIEKSNARINSDLVGLRRSYAGRVRALYKMSRSGYATAVLASDGPDNGLKRIKYLGIITERDRVLAREYGSALNALAVRQAEISEKKETILGHKRKIEMEETEFRSRKQKKATLLASVREEKGLSEQALHELEESSVSLWAMIKKTEQERKAAKVISPSPRVLDRDAGPGTGRLPWPAEGRVLTRFGMQRHPQFKTIVFRRGIEIAVREGEPVRAVSDGQVAYGDWYKGYGRLMIVEHGPGFYTLYGNLSRLDLNKGDRVTRGQVLGLAGETGSLKGAKLYFEIRRNGVAQDPLVWLAKR
ncbi:MAG TPA: peptidoglycan DD-metalloendopeptidase family protein [Nitrospirota bacterium]|nr:peptidoglycan DD-metalloendopeptidase family protein [Nitrospirota bacterium]